MPTILNLNTTGELIEILGHRKKVKSFQLKKVNAGDVDDVARVKMIGFETYSKWNPEEYVGFINQNGFSVQTWKVLKAAFPLVYLEAKLQE